MARVAGLRALVTGGSSGIGAAIVERLRADGAAVAFTGRSAERGAEVAGRTGAVFFRADATDPAQVADATWQACEALGGLDALVLNAGAIVDGPLSQTSDAEWDALLATNVLAPFDQAMACLPALRSSAHASIATVASDAGLWGETACAAYSVTKRALVMLTQMLAVELGPEGVRANAVCPGDTAPGMRSTPGGYVERDGSTEGWLTPPLGRVGRAEDVAAAVAFLVSDDAAFINGATLLIDGGMRAGLDAWSVAQ